MGLCIRERLRGTAAKGGGSQLSLLQLRQAEIGVALLSIGNRMIIFIEFISQVGMLYDIKIIIMSYLYDPTNMIK